MNKKIILTTIAIMTISFSSFCQKNYLKGYLIHLNGDTLNGFIDYRNWEKNPKQVYFKTAIDGQRILYTPIMIKGFSVSNEIYESAVVDIEISDTRLGDLNYDRRLKLKVDTIFLQTLIRGTKSLYLNSDFGKELLYIKRDSMLELLLHKRFWIRMEVVEL